MILNRVNYENEEEEIKEDEEANNKPQDKIEKKEKITKKKKDNEKEEEEEEDDEEEEEEDDDEEKEGNEENEENDDEVDNEDNHKKKMISKEPEEENISTLKNKIFYYKIFSIILIIIVFLIVLIIILASRRGKTPITLFNKNNNQTNATTFEVDLNKDKLNMVKNELNNIYNNNGELNVIKFYEENINKKIYNPQDISRYKSVHIAIGFCEADIDIVIKHLASAIFHSSPTTFLHIHMFDADTFSYESLLKLKNVIYKINNNTEIIVYNAVEALKSFTIRDNSLSKFAKEYAKLYAFKLIKNVQIILFLDAYSCMVQKDLSELYSIDMNDIYGRGISEVPSIRYPVDWMDQYLYDKSHFINGGVVLVNLELCQKEDFFHKIKELNNNEFYTKTEEPFQDILNILMRKKIEFFHPKFNKINFYQNPEDKNNEQNWYPWVIETLKQSEKNNHFYTKEDLIQADNDPVIIQYIYDKQLNKTNKKYEDDKNFYGKLAGIS